MPLLLVASERVAVTLDSNAKTSVIRKMGTTTKNVEDSQTYIKNGEKNGVAS